MAPAADAPCPSPPNSTSVLQRCGWPSNRTHRNRRGGALSVGHENPLPRTAAPRSPAPRDWTYGSVYRAAGAREPTWPSITNRALALLHTNALVFQWPTGRARVLARRVSGVLSLCCGERGRNRTYNLLIKSRKDLHIGISGLRALLHLYESFTCHFVCALLRWFSHGFCLFMTKECQSQEGPVANVGCDPTASATSSIHHPSR